MPGGRAQYLVVVFCKALGLDRRISTLSCGERGLGQRNTYTCKTERLWPEILILTDILVPHQLISEEYFLYLRNGYRWLLWSLGWPWLLPGGRISSSNDGNKQAVGGLRTGVISNPCSSRREASSLVPMITGACIFFRSIRCIFALYRCNQRWPGA